MSVERILSSVTWLAESGGALVVVSEWGVAIAIALLLVAFALIVAEIFLPSGGALSMVAAFLLVVSVIAAVLHDTTIGLVYLIAVLVLTPKFAIMVLKLVLPRTAVGERMIHRGNPVSDTERRAVVHEEKTLVGHVGQTVTPLRPGGRAEIAGESRDVVTQNGEMVDVGKSVHVVEVSGNRIVVRPIDALQE